jgi:antitoxin CptB
VETITDGRIRWKCRRGLLELDIVLEKFCESALPTLSQEEKQLFFVFLDTPDQVLLDWVFTQDLPDNELDKQFVLMMRKVRP